MTRDELFRTLKRAVAGSFEVLAELGRGDGGKNAYVARELATGALVVLELNLEDTDPDGRPNYGLFIRRELDASIPALSLRCSKCGASISGWARYCPNCDADVSGVSHTTGGRTAAELLRSGELSGQDRYEFLGEMPRAEGGGSVHIARERASGQLVALRVERAGTGPDAGYTLSMTQELEAVPGPGTTHTPPQRPKVAWREKEEGAAPPAEPPTEARVVAGAAAESGGAKAGAPGGYCPMCGASYEPGIWFCPRDGSPIKPAVVTDKLIGQTIAGRFHVRRKLGSGAMGTVYLAEHVRMGRPCALKIMNTALKDDPEALGRFAREAASASRITHPNVAAIYDFGEAEDGTVYLAMEYADGESLGALMKRECPVPPERSVEIISQVLDGLAAAHAIGIVHRDLKPDNIILAKAPTGKHVVKVVDFGIAKAMQSTESQQLTRTGFVVGTPRYMSPEQIMGGAIDGRSDLYSADCILYEMLVGAVPFTGPSGEITITRRLTEAPPHPRRIKQSLDKKLDQVVVRAMAREPDDRYHTAEEFRAALTEAMRTDTGGALTKKAAAVTQVVGSAGRAATGLLTRAGRSAVSGIGAAARGAGAAAAAGTAGAAGALRVTATAGGAGARGAGRLLRPLLNWKFAALVVGLVALGFGGPATVRWWHASRAQRAAQDSVAAALAAANQPETTSEQYPDQSLSGSADTVPAAVAPTTSSESPVTPAAEAARPPITSAPATRPADTALAPPRPLTVPMAVIDSLRAKLRLANFFAEREEYAEAFEQLRLVRTRLDALRLDFPTAASLRTIRQQHADALSSITSFCQAARQVALGRGENPPVCR